MWLRRMDDDRPDRRASISFEASINPAQLSDPSSAFSLWQVRGPCALGVCCMSQGQRGLCDGSLPAFTQQQVDHTLATPLLCWGALCAKPHLLAD